MADRAIQFSPPMLRALLDGRKTQTRRVLQGKSGITAAHRVERAGHAWLACEYDRRWPLRLPCAPGDRLWVREAWRTNAMWDHLKPSQLAGPDHPDGRSSVLFEVGGALPNSCDKADAGRYRHRRFMPRWASRLTLLVTDVRVQRLQDISAADARAEGCDHPLKGSELDGVPGDYVADERTSFAILWNRLHGPDAWDENPWVVAISFDVVRGNIDEVKANG